MLGTLGLAHHLMAAIVEAVTDGWIQLMTVGFPPSSIVDKGVEDVGQRFDDVIFFQALNHSSLMYDLTTRGKNRKFSSDACSICD
jgi:hypothetical protein